MRKLIVALGLLGALALAAGAAKAEKGKKARGQDVGKALFEGKDKVSKEEFVKFFMDRVAPGPGSRPEAKTPSPEQRRERLGKLFDALDNDPRDNFVTPKEWKADQERRRQHPEGRRKDGRGKPDRP